MRTNWALLSVERTEKTTSCGWKGALESNDWLQLRRKSVAATLKKAR
jgi:hypothetical protein